jgi:hypothetical protein
MKQDEESGRGHRRRACEWLIAVSLGAVTAGFLTVSAELTNDHYGMLSSAQQILLGDIPVRDFVDEGRPLQIAVATLGQWLFGANALTEIVICAVFVGLAVAAVFLQVSRWAGSVGLALVMVLICAVAPLRLYSYPKLAVYPAALFLLGWYLKNPTKLRLVGLGGVTGVAFLLRHDHGVYVGIGTAVALLLANRPIDVAAVGRRMGLYVASALVVVTPYLAFVSVTSGLGSYIQIGLDFSVDEGRRTRLQRLPHFDIEWVAPLFEFTPDTPPPRQITIRWSAAATEQDRELLEARFRLANRRADDDVTDQYDLLETSSDNLRAIAEHPLVADTGRIDRHTFEAPAEELYAKARRWMQGVSLLPGVLRSENAVPWFFYLTWTVTAFALIMGAWTWVRDPTSGALLASATVMCMLVALGMLREPMASRFADVLPTVALVAALALRTARRGLGGQRRDRRLVRYLIGSVAVVSVLAAWSAGDTSRTLPDSYESARARMESMASDRAYFFRNQVGLAGYLSRCLHLEQRILVGFFGPEVPYLAGRGFAGGQVYFMDEFGRSSDQQRLALTRWRNQDVPVVLADTPRSEPPFGHHDLLQTYLMANYDWVGTFDLGDHDLSVYANRRSGRTPDLDTGLPCFHDTESSDDQ